MKTIAFVLAASCGRPLPILPSKEASEAALSALHTIHDVMGEEVYFGASTALYEIQEANESFRCGNIDADGCTKFEPDDVTIIRVNGDPKTCLFRAILTHEFVHLWICRTSFRCDPTHKHPSWPKAWDAFQDALHKSDCDGQAAAG